MLSLPALTCARSGSLQAPKPPRLQAPSFPVVLVHGAILRHNELVQTSLFSLAPARKQLVLMQWLSQGWEQVLGFVLGVVLGVALGTGAWCLWRRRQAARAVERRRRAMEAFRLRREQLEAQFVQAVSNSGRPRGLLWKEVEFADEVTFALQRDSSRLVALVAVTVAFEAVPGGPMEDVEAVGRLRSATAVFVEGPGGWEAPGRVLFNLQPHQALEHFAHELSPLPQLPSEPQAGSESPA